MAPRIDELIGRYPDVQLATLVDAVPEGADWVHEIKFDGYRLLGFRAGQTVRLVTRNGKDWTGKFPSLSAALSGLAADDAVLDMEAVVVDGHGKSSFQSLQNALSGNGDTHSIVAYVFDLLYLNGKDLTKLALLERKGELEALLRTSKTLRYSAHITGQGEEMFAKACQTGLEGIISKEANAPYVRGRGKSWLKIKCSLRQEFIIVGYSDPRRGERALGALYLGYRKDDALQYAGKVGTGFTMKSAEELATRLTGIGVTAPVLSRAETAGLGAGEWRAVHWVKPALLCEVAFTEWTADGRIRHPSFQGLREDKNASQVSKETPVAPAVKTASVEGRQAEGLVLHGITITHPDRVISDTGHITKGELAEYYAAVAPRILPQIVRHPLSLLRCPSGVDKQCFFQRNPGRGLGAGVRSFEFRNKGKTYEYLYIEDEKGLLEVVQMGAVELHPWGASIDSIDCPDRMIFDLDPAPDVPFEALKLGAQDLRQRLRRKGLESSLKCTGGKGLHVTVPLAGKDSWSTVKRFAASVADEMVAATPEAYVATMSKAKRTGRIFIDYFRNDYTATAIADYAVRARPGAPVALPIEWKELKNLESASQFTMQDVLGTIAEGEEDTPRAFAPYDSCGLRPMPSAQAPHHSPTVLILIDVINHFEFPDGEKVLRQALPIAPRLARLKKRAQAAGISTIYVNDNFGQWRSDVSRLLEHCLRPEAIGKSFVEQIQPTQNDYFVLKPMHSGFYQTPLEVLLRYLNASTLVLGGLTTNSCIVCTAHDAKMREFELYVPSDCSAARTVKEHRQAIQHIRTMTNAKVAASKSLRLHEIARK